MKLNNKNYVIELLVLKNYYQLFKLITIYELKSQKYVVN